MTPRPLPLQCLAAAAPIAACVLLFAGFSKIQTWSDFIRDVQNHGVVPSTLVQPLGVAFISIELLTGLAALCLALRQHRTGAAPCLLLAVFFAGLTSYCLVLCMHPPAIRSGCGCGFSRTLVQDWTPLAIRNAAAASAFLLASLVLRYQGRPQPFTHQHPGLDSNQRPAA